MYLHEHDNWTDFTWDSTAVASLLADVRFAQGHLLGRVSDLGFNVMQSAEFDSLADEIVTSFGIEGVAIDARSVRSSLARQLGIDYAESVRDTRQIDGVVEMTLDAAKDFSRPLTNRRLFGWHAALFPSSFSGMHRIAVGRYRSTEMQVVSGPVGREKVHYQAPAPNRVKALMREFLAWYNGGISIDPVIKAGVAHLWFVTIHPFDDGNGRMARALTEMQLSRSDGSPRRFYSLSGRILVRRKTYYQVLERTQRGRSEITPWLVWFLETLLEALRQSEKELEGVIVRATFWQRLEGIPLNERQRKVLNRLLAGFEGKLTTSKWAKMTKVSQDTATRDINDLLDKGILTKTSGGRSTSYALTFVGTAGTGLLSHGMRQTGDQGGQNPCVFGSNLDRVSVPVGQELHPRV
jgi:Fic family protein